MRRIDRSQQGLRIGRLSQRLGDPVALVALVRVVAAEFLQERNDLRGLLLGQDRDLERQLVAAGRQFVVVALSDRE